MRSLFLILVATFALQVEANPEPLERFAQRLAQIDGVMSGFQQETRDAFGQTVDAAQGFVQIARPNVRWDVRSPFPQSIVLTQDTLRIYDPDLEQVTVRDIANTWSEVPLAMFTREDANWDQVFQVSSGSSDETFVLTPLSDEALFATLTVSFHEDGLKAIVIVDRSAQETRISFENYRDGQVIQSEAFQLELPPDTEIVKG